MMMVDIIRVTFTVWSLAMGPVATTCGLSPIDGRFPGAGIVRATSGAPNADTITLTLRGDAVAIDCAQGIVVQVMTGGA